MSRSREAVCLIPSADRERIRKRFDASYIPEPMSGCWLWEGVLHPTGYPRIKVLDRPLGAHRVAILLAGVEIPAGMHAAHRCHNRACVNPDHIRPLSSEGNARENRERGLGRDRLGVANWRAKLSEAEVVEIRGALAEGVNPAEVARRFGVSRRTVNRIRTGENWGHIVASLPARSVTP